MRKNAAFTLVELLVVITIITVLIALLMPMLRHSIEQAKVIRCMSNFKQCGVVCMAYADDHNTYFPPCYPLGRPEGYRKISPPANDLRPIIAPYLNNQFGIWKCGFINGKDITDSGNTSDQLYVNIWYMPGIGANLLWDVAPTNYREERWPYQRVLMQDHLWNDGTLFRFSHGRGCLRYYGTYWHSAVTETPSGRISSLHMVSSDINACTSANVLFFDGSVKQYKSSQMDYKTQAGGRIYFSIKPKTD